MSDFLRHLAGRELGVETGLRPRRPSRFEYEPHASVAQEAAALEGENEGHGMAAPQPMPWRRLRFDAPPTVQDAHATAVSAPPEQPSKPAASLARTEHPRTPSHTPAGGHATHTIAPEVSLPTPPSRPAIRFTEPLLAVKPAQHSALAELQPRTEPLSKTPQRTLLPPAGDRHVVKAAAESDQVRRTAPARSPVSDAPVLTPLAEPILRQRMPTREPHVRADTIVQVSIGRVEVRAAPTQRTAAPTRRDAPSASSLEDYLRERNGGRGA